MKSDERHGICLGQGVMDFALELRALAPLKRMRMAWIADCGCRMARIADCGLQNWSQWFVGLMCNFLFLVIGCPATSDCGDLQDLVATLNEIAQANPN